MNAYKMFSGSKGGSSGQGQSASGGSGTGGNSMDMINNAMKVYKMFSGDKSASGSGSGASGGGNIFDTIGMLSSDFSFLFYYIYVLKNRFNLSKCSTIAGFLKIIR